MQQARNPSRVVVSSVIERSQREELERRAAEQDRTISYLVRCAVREYLHSGSGVTGGASHGASPNDREAA